MEPERTALPAVRLDRLLDVLVEPVIITDANAVVTSVNPVAVERLGADQYVGRSLAEQVARADVRAPGGRALAWAEHPVHRALATGAPVTNVELVVSSGAPAATTWLVNTVPVRDADRILGTVSVFHDITRSVELETTLGDHAQRLEAIVNLVSDAVFLVDGDGRLIFANAVGDRMLGLPPNTPLAERHRRLDARDGDGQPIPLDRFPSRLALEGETLTGVTLLIRDANGETRHVMTSAHPLRRRDGTIYAALVTMNDVTDEILGRLELEVARETAEEANHLKDQFIAALSHELRTPLQPILGWTEVLRRHGNLDAVTTQALEAIRRNIRQQVRLVDDLLDLSCIVHGKLALRYETFDLREQVRSAAEPFEESSALKRVRLQLSLRRTRC